MHRRFSPLTVTTLASLAGLSFLAACSDTTAPTSLRAGAASFIVGPTAPAAGSTIIPFVSSGSTQYCSGTPGAYTVPGSFAPITSGCGTAFNLQGALAAYNPGWDENLGGTAVGASAWIGPNANANEYKTLPGTYVFQTTFTLPGTYANPVLNDTLLSDNAVAVYLNGNLVETQVIADCATGINCNWNTTNKFVISDNNPAHFVSGTNYITVLLVDTPNGGNAGNSYACTKLPQPAGRAGFSGGPVDTYPNHVYAGFTPSTTLAQYAAAGCQNPTGLDFSGTVAYTVPATLQWCSPGFWKNHYPDAWGGVSGSLLYNQMIVANKAPLSKKAGAGANPTILQVISDPSTYGGPATNSVADYLSGIIFGANVGTSADDANCNGGVPLVQGGGSF